MEQNDSWRWTGRVAGAGNEGTGNDSSGLWAGGPSSPTGEEAWGRRALFWRREVCNAQEMFTGGCQWAVPCEGQQDRRDVRGTPKPLEHGKATRSQL